MKTIFVDNEIHYKIKKESVEEKKSIKEFVKDMFFDYIKRKETKNIMNVTPETIQTIKEEIKKCFLKKDGTKFTNKKIYWINDLIKMVKPNLKQYDENLIIIIFHKLVDAKLLIKNYKDEIYYNWELEENINGFK